MPNVCLKVPTGGGKTLLAAHTVAVAGRHFLERDYPVVLWVVPNEAIYRQTLAALGNRDHPYRQILNVAGAGRVKVLEKTAPLTRLDVDGGIKITLDALQGLAYANDKQVTRLSAQIGLPRPAGGLTVSVCPDDLPPGDDAHDHGL